MGKRAEVLFEEQTMIDGKTYFVGYTKEYVRVAIPADQDYANRELTGILRAGTGRTCAFAVVYCSLYEHLPTRTEEIHQGVAGVFGRCEIFVSEKTG